MRGVVAIPVILIILAIGLVGAGSYVYLHNRTNVPSEVTVSPTPIPSASPTVTPSPSPTFSTTPKVTATPKASTAPLIDCIGPDGKHARLTKTACDNLNKAWTTPTPSPTATTTSSGSATGCAAYNLGGSLGTLTVNLQVNNGSMQGDAGVTINHKYSGCGQVDPGFPVIQVISQGSSSTTFSGMRPGPFHIDVQYHGNTSGYDVNVNSGSNSITATVSN